MIRATFDALSNLQSPRGVASRRGLKVSSVVGKKVEKNTDKDAKEA